ncbi:MAG: hypothetical protein P8Y99_17040, partial [Calditrichaceae bacterium]
LAVLYILSCENNKSNEKALNENDIKEFKQEIENEIKARKIDIMQMKQDIEGLQDSAKSKLLIDINQSEKEIIQLDDSYNKLKDMSDSIWTEMRPKIDSTMRYLGASIDSTKLHILVEKEEQQED